MNIEDLERLTSLAGEFNDAADAYCQSADLWTPCMELTSADAYVAWQQNLVAYARANGGPGSAALLDIDRRGQEASRAISLKQRKD